MTDTVPIQIKLPKELHTELKVEAAKQRITLRELILSKLKS